MTEAHAGPPGPTGPADAGGRAGSVGPGGPARPVGPALPADAAPRGGEPFDAVDVIRTKRDGGRLSDEQIDWVLDAYTRDAVADEQMSALLMAVLLRGLEPAELARWTGAMISSGERLDLSGVHRPTVDKHSTGGVVDKI